jgi:hypothetical protein
VDELLALRREASAATAAGEEEEWRATKTFGSAVERCCFGEDVLVVELRRQRRRLRPLAVEEILAVSESRIGESNWDSGTVVATVNARACVGVGAEDVGEVRYSFVPVMDSVERATTSAGPFPFACAKSSTLHGSVLMMVANCGPEGVVGTVGSTQVREREDEREVTALRTRSCRLLDEDDIANLRWLLSRLRVLLGVGVGVGITLSSALWS